VKKKSNGQRNRKSEKEAQRGRSNKKVKSTNEKELPGAIRDRDKIGRLKKGDKKR
jgi:hypothetical protein